MNGKITKKKILRTDQNMTYKFIISKTVLITNKYQTK